MLTVHSESIYTSLVKPKLLLFFKDFSHWTRASCVGLQVAGYTTAKYLRHIGVDAHAFAVRHNVDIVREINHHSPTHVAISAPWLTLHDLKGLVLGYPHIRFTVICHSNVGFLQADPGGIELLRLYAELARHVDNLSVSGNCPHFVNWFRVAYQERCHLLPNLYLVERRRGKRWSGTHLRIGALGAIRPEKNLMTAAAASLAIYRELGVPTELHMSTGGEECRCSTLRAIEEMTEGFRHFKLIRHHWNFWDQFIRLIKTMDLVIQVSYTESFNMVTADAISEGVPVVVSPPIYWAPSTWRADPDNALDVARVGSELLRFNQKYKGADALLRHDRAGAKHWLRFLSLD